MLIAYLVIAFFVTGLGAMFMGAADFALVIIFGVINTFIAKFYFKIDLLKSIFTGFLISSLGLVVSYLLWMPISNLTFSDDLIISGFISNGIFQTFSWLLVNKFIVKKSRIIAILIFLFMGLGIFASFSLYDYWKFEKYYNWNEKKRISIKVSDSITKGLIIGDSIQLTVERQPLYGLMTGSLIKKTITDENGISQFEVYLGNRHLGRIWRNDNLGDYFEISKDDLIENDTIEIKTTANTGYNSLLHFR